MGEFHCGLNDGLRHFELAEQHAGSRHDVAGQHTLLNAEVEVGALHHNDRILPFK